MRIISDFHDYYDSGMRFETCDETVIYKRNEEIIHLSPFLEKEIYGDKKEFNDFCLIDRIRRPASFNYLLYCGETIPFIINSNNLKSATKFLYNAGEFEEYYFKNDKELLKNYKQKPKYEFRFLSIKQQNIENFFEEKIKNSHNIHLKFNTPLILLLNCGIDYLNRGSSILIRNPNLRAIEFFKIKTIYEVFQDIEMYLTNELVVEQKISEISDEYKIQKHGFDKKISFRKQKQFTKK